MAFTTSTSPSEDIIVQEGTFAFDFDASGSVYAGQAVYCNHTLAVAAPGGGLTSPQHGCVGIAAYDQTNGNPVAVYGPGNICRAIYSGTACRTGDILFCGNDGKLEEYVGTSQPSGVAFIALEDQSTNNGTVRVLVY